MRTLGAECALGMTLTIELGQCYSVYCNGPLGDVERYGHSRGEDARSDA